MEQGLQCQTPAEVPIKLLSADRLLIPNGFVQIEFKGQIYTLRQTRNDKLILTK